VWGRLARVIGLSIRFIHKYSGNDVDIMIYIYLFYFDSII